MIEDESITNFYNSIISSFYEKDYYLNNNLNKIENTSLFLNYLLFEIIKKREGSSFYFIDELIKKEKKTDNIRIYLEKELGDLISFLKNDYSGHLNFEVQNSILNLIKDKENIDRMIENTLELIIFNNRIIPPILIPYIITEEEKSRIFNKKKYLILLFNSSVSLIRNTIISFQSNFIAYSDFNILGIKDEWVNFDTGRFFRCVFIDENLSFKECEFETPVIADAVLFTNFKSENEIEKHIEYTQKFKQNKIETINPFIDGLILSKSNISKYVEYYPEYKLIRKDEYSDDLLKEFEDFTNNCHESIFVQPDFSTEGIGISFFNKDNYTVNDIASYIKDNTQKKDVIVRKDINNIYYKSENCNDFYYTAFRINVEFDNNKYYARTGYALYNKEKIVSSTRGAKMEDINIVFKNIYVESEQGYIHVRINNKILKNIMNSTIKAIYSLQNNLSEKSKIFGVDVVLNAQLKNSDIELKPYILDINIRPVISNSVVIRSFN